MDTGKIYSALIVIPLAAARGYEESRIEEKKRTFFLSITINLFFNHYY